MESLLFVLAYLFRMFEKHNTEMALSFPAL